MKEIHKLQKVLDEIVARTGGEFAKMSIADRRKTQKVFREYKKIIDRFIKREYYRIQLWSNLDLDNLNEVEDKIN